MSKASEASLAELHGAVAEALTMAVQGVTTDEGIIVASAAHIMAAITFLKNNNITADASSNAELSELSRQLAQKRSDAKGRMSRGQIAVVVDELERDMGDAIGGLQ